MTDTTTVVLGRTPAPLQVLLIPGDPFVCSLTRDDGLSWTDLPHIELGTAAAWVATGSGAVATFNIPSATVDAVIASAPTSGRLVARLTVGGLVWASGSVFVVDA